MSLTAVCLIGVLVATSSAAPSAEANPAPCKTPKQWEGSAVIVDYETGLGDAARISYDEVNERVRMHLSSVNGRFKREIDTIMLFKDDKFYFFNEKVKKCKVTKALFDFKPAGVPVNSTFVASAVTGLGSDTLSTNTFVKTHIHPKHSDESETNDSSSPDHHHHHHHGGHVHTVLVTVTPEPTCAPVSDSVLEGDRIQYPDGPIVLLGNTDYFGLTAGIASTKVFEPPDYCKSNSTNVEMYYDDFQWYSFMFA